MNPTNSEKIRNVAVVGQTGSGKTSLVEAIYHHIEKTSRKGRIEDGNTVSDFEAEEIKHKHSISLSLIALDCGGYKINLLDTPGVVDFIGEVHSGLGGCDMALFVVSASEEITYDTRRIWNIASANSIPRMIFINKMDKDRANFEDTIDTLSLAFGAGIAPIELPIGNGPNFAGIIDLFDETSTSYSSGLPTISEIPADIAITEHRAHDLLVEGIVIADDSAMAAYLEGEVPPKAELEELMAQGVAKAQVFPVVVGSATSQIGIDRLVTFLCEIAPPPNSNTNDALGLQTFKTYSDPFLGHLSLTKIISGTLKVDSECFNHRSNATEKIHSFFSLVGKEHLNLATASSGDIVAIAKLGSLRTGDFLGTPNSSAPRQLLEFPKPTLSYKVTPAAKADEEKLSLALSKIIEEDSTLDIHRDTRSHALILSGIGELQLTTALEKAQRRYGVKATLSPCDVAYLESLAGTCEVEGKYKKQSGGHGQFGVARLRFGTKEIGGGFSFHDEIVGGSIPRQFIPAVEKGIVDGANTGGKYGFPVVDFEAHLYDGAYHSVDSSEMAFKMAGSIALREAIDRLGTVVLEPISQIKVSIPPQLQGEVLGNLNSHRAKVLGSDHDQATGRFIISAVVPTNELMTYSNELRSITAGQGEFDATFDHYEPLPKALYGKYLT